MARERIIAPEAHRHDEPAPDGRPASDEMNGGGGRALRPRRLDEYVGQRELIQRLTIAPVVSR